MKTTLNQNLWNISALAGLLVLGGVAKFRKRAVVNPAAATRE